MLNEPRRHAAAPDLLDDIAPKPAPAPPPAPRVVRYDGDDLRERARSRFDLSAEHHRLCGPPRLGAWSCFAHEDRTPSLRMRQGSAAYACCYGGSHPDWVGRRRDGYTVVDLFDVLARESGISTAALLSALVRAERTSQPTARPAVIPHGVTGLDDLLGAA